MEIKAGEFKQIKNGFADYYYLDTKGNVFNKNTNKYLKKSKKNLFRLNTQENQAKYISLKNLYYLVFEKIYCIDEIEDLENEEWRIIPNTNKEYLISNCGRCKSLADYNAKIVKEFSNHGGYKKVGIMENGRKANKFIHVLVANAFLGKPDNLEMQIHHKDFINDNNVIDNLEYLTREEHLNKHNERRLQQLNERRNENDSIDTGISAE